MPVSYTHLLQLKVMQKSGFTRDQLENMKSPMDRIDLEKVIFPFIKRCV